MKLSIYKIIKLISLITILSLNNIVTLELTSSKIKIFLERRRSKRSSSKTRLSPADKFLKFVKGFKDAFQSSLFSSCLDSLFPTTGTTNDSVDTNLSLDKMYANVKNESLTIFENTIRAVKSPECKATQVNKDNFVNGSTIQKKYDKIMGDYSPNDGVKGIDLPGMFTKNTDKSKRPSGIDLFNFAERALTEAKVLCLLSSTDPLFKKLTNQIESLSLTRKELTESEFAMDTGISWEAEVKAKLNQWFKAITGLFTDFKTRLSNFIKCEVESFKNAWQSQVLAWTIQLTEIAISAIPVIGTVAKIIRFFYSYYEIYTIAKKFYDASQNTDDAKRYEGYGAATFSLVRSLIYIFTGFKYGQIAPSLGATGAGRVAGSIGTVHK